MMNILIVHGPNLNLLGRREPEVYGRENLADIDKRIDNAAEQLGVEVKTGQFSSEGDIVDFLAENADWADGLVINPAAYTHTSVAIADAIKGLELPAVEVHLSNVQAREEFRKQSFIAPVAIGQVSGFGPESYVLGLKGLVVSLSQEAR